MSKKDPATDAVIPDAIGGVNVSERGSSTADKPFDVSPSAFEGISFVPSSPGFPQGVFNDPSSGCLQFLCIAGAGAVKPDDHIDLDCNALYIVGSGEINVQHEDEDIDGNDTVVVRRHIVTMGHVFRVLTKAGHRPIMRLMTSAGDGRRQRPPAKVIALACGAVSAVTKNRQDRSVHHTLRRLEATGKLTCSRCGGHELRAWAQPEEDEPSKHPLFIAPGSPPSDFSPAYVQAIKQRMMGSSA